VDIVLGVSMTPTTVRMVLVEGEKADGSIVDHDLFEVAANEGSATSSNAAEQVVEAILGTKESAAAGGHHLKSIGVTWSDHAEASTLRDALSARGVDDVMLVSDGHAAGALAQAAGRAVGYATTALLFIDRDTATLSVVQTDDGSVVKVLSQSLHSDDAMAVLTEMAAAVDAQDSPPQGMFVVGSGVDVTSVKAHLATLVSLPVSAPDQPELALARGAALASANAPTFEATTVGLAYSQDPDGTTAGNAYVGLAAAETQLAPVSGEDYAAQTDLEPIAAEEGRKPFLLVGSALTSIFVVGVVALVISLAVSIRPTVDQRPAPGESAIVPSTVAPAPAPVQEAHQTAGARRCAGSSRAQAGAASGLRRAGARPAGTRACTRSATATSRGAAARSDSGGASAGSIYPGAGVQPAGVQPVSAAAGLHPAAQAVATAVDAAVAAAAAAGAAAAGPAGRSADTSEPAAVAVAGIWRGLGWLGFRWLRLGWLGFR
jgi:hypothetical protein